MRRLVAALVPSTNASEPGAVATGSIRKLRNDPVAMLRTLTSLLSQRERKLARGSDTTQSGDESPHSKSKYFYLPKIEYFHSFNLSGNLPVPKLS